MYSGSLYPKDRRYPDIWIRTKRARILLAFRRCTAQRLPVVKMSPLLTLVYLDRPISPPPVHVHTRPCRHADTRAHTQKPRGLETKNSTDGKSKHELAILELQTEDPPRSSGYAVLRHDFWIRIPLERSGYMISVMSVRQEKAGKPQTAVYLMFIVTSVRSSNVRVGRQGLYATLYECLTIHADTHAQKLA